MVIKDAEFKESGRMQVQISIPLKNGVGSVTVSCDPSKDELTLTIPGLDRDLTISRNDLADLFSRIGPRLSDMGPGGCFGIRAIRPIDGGPIG